MITTPRILLLITLVFLPGCGSLLSKPADEAYARQLVGTWSSEYTDRQGNITSYGEKTYAADGTARGFIVFPAASAGQTCSNLRKLTFESRWRVVDGVLETTDAVYAPSSLNEGGNETIRDRILGVSDGEARFENVSDGSRFVRKRIR
jgi:hypothetical protein